MTVSPSFVSRLSSALVRWLKRDGWVMALYAIITILMTYPIVTQLTGNWIASRDPDTYMTLWDQWWFAQVISGHATLNYTHNLFFPAGVDLTFHSNSLLTSVLIWLSTPFLGSSGAYNFNILVAVFTTAYAGYLLIRSMVEHPAAAWLGGLIYSFLPYHIAHAGSHPNLAHLAGIPIAALLLMRAWSKPSVWSALGAALIVGLIALTSLYILDIAAITLLLLFIGLMFQRRRWRTANFWKITLVFGAATIVALGPRILPILQSPNALTSALQQKYDALHLQTDVVSFVTPSHFNPLFEPYVGDIAAHFEMNKKWPAYLGLIPLVLCVSALTWKKQRGLVLTWAMVGLVFMVMALGLVLRFNGHLYRNIVLPLNYLQGLPPVKVMRPDYFVLGLSLPLAVVASFGFDRWLGALARRRRAQKLLVFGITCLLLFEYWNGPYPGFINGVSEFYAQIQNQPGPNAIIDLPMGSGASKEYMYLQITHHQPIVEGIIGRIPPEAYQYINGNALLSLWSSNTPLDCKAISRASIKQALDQLAADHFRYIVVHQPYGNVPGEFAGYLTSIPIYSDSAITVFAVADLQANPPCTTQ